VSRLLEYRQLGWEMQFLRREVQRDFDFDKLIGKSAGMREIERLIRKVAPTPSTVLISGESGAGKEVVARAIHHHSDLRNRIFLPINCAAIPETLLESQLFGHTRGAFTGAVNSQEGLFARARGGTVFLDEIGDMPLTLQPKLLRAIEAKEILPVGSTQPVKVDIRIIAATHRDLGAMAAAGEFREDLYYRLNVVNVQIPPLRDRREDIPDLVEFLVRRHSIEMKKSFRGVDNAALKVLMSQPWKGNVRELDNVIEHAMIVGDGPWITVNDLPARIHQGRRNDPVAAGDDLKSAMRLYERNHLANVLERTEGDKRKAAELLGISLSSLYRKIEELELAEGPAVRA
jgi:transcriptional regulator with PAS, ATPase and Fis domain